MDKLACVEQEEVHYWNLRDNRMQHGRVVKFKADQLLILAENPPQYWCISHAAIQLDPRQAPLAQPPRPLGRADFALGGSATATVTCPTCPPPADRCGPVPIQFEAGPGDTFYATSIDTDNAFYIAGRSTLMNAILAQAGQIRATAPLACP